MKNNKNIIYILAVIVGLVIVNAIASNVYLRYDLTKDNRYTLSEVTQSMLTDLDSPFVLN